MIAASPNCRSRSTSSTRRPARRAIWVASEVASTVLPTPPLGENTVRTRPSAVEARSDGRCQPPRRGGELAGLLDREHQRVGELRQHHDVGDAGAERLVQQRARAAGGDEDDRRGRRVTDGVDLGAGQAVAAGGAVQDHLRAARGELLVGLARLDGGADDLDLGMALERLAHLGEAGAGAGDEGLDRGSVRHQGPHHSGSGRGSK